MAVNCIKFIGCIFSAVGWHYRCFSLHSTLESLSVLNFCYYALPKFVNYLFLDVTTCKWVCMQWPVTVSILFKMFDVSGTVNLLVIFEFFTPLCQFMVSNVA